MTWVRASGAGDPSVPTGGVPAPRAPQNPAHGAHLAATPCSPELSPSRALLAPSARLLPGWPGSRLRDPTGVFESLATKPRHHFLTETDLSLVSSSPGTQMHGLQALVIPW